MRIAMVNRWLEPGGLITSIKYFASYASGKGHEVYLIAAAPLPEHRAWYPAELGKTGLKLIECPFPNPTQSKPKILLRGLKSRLMVGPILDRIRPDIVHVHAPFMMIFFSGPVRRRGIPLVFSLHNSVNRRFWHGIWPLSAADSFVAVSADMPAELKNVWGVAEERIKYIPYGIDPRDFPALSEAERERARAGLGIARDPLVFLLLGRIDPVKGHEELLLAAEKARSMLPDFCILFQGSALTDARRQWIEKLIKSHARLKVLRRDFGHPREAYAAADVLVLPSLFGEALPLTVLEAQALGIPVIRTRTAGAADQIEHLKTGWLCKPGDVDALAQCLIQAGDREKAKAVGEAGRVSVLSRFNINVTGERLLELYQSLLR